MKVDEQTVTTTELETVETENTTITEVSETSADITSDITSAEITEENTTNVIPSETIVGMYNYTPASGEISYETTIVSTEDDESSICTGIHSHGR